MRLDRSKFKAWLATKPPAEIVGINRDCLSCPIANFYGEVSGASIVVSGEGGDYFIDRGDGRRRAPAWAEHFFADVDAEQNGEITARRAIEILEAA